MRLTTRRSALVLVILAAGCSKTKTSANRDSMTQRQKDSVLGQSTIPNAGIITKAQAVADSLSAATAKANAVGADTTDRRP